MITGCFFRVNILRSNAKFKKNNNSYKETRRVELSLEMGSIFPVEPWSKLTCQVPQTSSWGLKMYTWLKVVDQMQTRMLTLNISGFTSCYTCFWKQRNVCWGSENVNVCNTKQAMSPHLTQNQVEHIHHLGYAARPPHTRVPNPLFPYSLTMGHRWSAFMWKHVVLHGVISRVELEDPYWDGRSLCTLETMQKA